MRIDLEEYLNGLLKQFSEEDVLRQSHNLHQCDGAADWRVDELPSGEMICYWPYDRPATQHQVNVCPFCGVRAKIGIKKE